jgi:hypothetical protein
MCARAGARRALVLAAALVAAAAACGAAEVPALKRSTAAERWREVADSGVKVRRIDRRRGAVPDARSELTDSASAREPPPP